MTGQASSTHLLWGGRTVSAETDNELMTYFDASDGQSQSKVQQTEWKQLDLSHTHTYTLIQTTA